jgi:hypothetical protein
VGIAVIEHQIVDQWDLTRHNTSVVCTVDRSECDRTTVPEYQHRRNKTETSAATSDVRKLLANDS